MKYKYFVSYFCVTNDSFGFANTEIVSDEKIDCFDDIEYLEEELLKNTDKCNKVTVINYQLMGTIEKEVE